MLPHLKEGNSWANYQKDQITAYTTLEDLLTEYFGKYPGRYRLEIYK